MVRNRSFLDVGGLGRDQLVGDALFASDERSQVAFQKLADRHLTDFSVTATPIKTTFVRRGETAKIGGLTVSGPADVVTEWQPIDASLVVTGADPFSTIQ